MLNEYLKEINFRKEERIEGKKYRKVFREFKITFLNLN